MRRRLIWVVLPTMYFRVMDNAHFDNLVCQALFGDGALVVVIGADPVVATAGGSGGERPLFELVHVTQTLIPETGGAILGLLREVGLMFSLISEVPSLITKHRGRAPQDGLQRRRRLHRP